MTKCLGIELQEASQDWTFNKVVVVVFLEPPQILKKLKWPQTSSNNDYF